MLKGKMSETVPANWSYPATFQDHLPGLPARRISSESKQAVYLIAYPTTCSAGQAAPTAWLTGQAAPTERPDRAS